MAHTAERGSSFVRASQLSALHWWVLGIALVVTITAAWISRQEAIAYAENRFSREVERAVEQVQFRMAKYETAVRAGVAAVHATPERPTREQWHTFAQQLAIDETYPGIAGIGLIISVARPQLEQHVTEFAADRPEYRPYPEHDRETLLPIVFIEPEARNFAAIGLDIAHEAARYNATERARASGQTQITGPIQLVQDDVGQAGFLLLTPFFNRNIMSDWDAPAGALLGFVYAPFNIEELLFGTLGRDTREVALRLRDGEQVLFDEWPGGASKPRHSTSLTLPMFGREWQFDAQSDGFAAATDTATAILVLGLTIDGILLLMFIAMARVNRRAVAHIQAVNEAHKSLSGALATANSELGDFAHVASQQLRAPLRGIVGLTEWIREDISAIGQPQVAEQIASTIDHVNTITQRARRMDSLINGILSYASVGSQPQSPETVKVSALVGAIRDDLELPEGAFSIHSEPDILRVDPSLVIQILRELIDNATRHHDHPDTMRVELHIREDELHYLFTVADNGPGIATADIDSAFQSFASLRQPEDTRMSGLGLTLAKKIAESVGGAIRISTVDARGTRVHVRWPKSELIEIPEAAA